MVGITRSKVIHGFLFGFPVFTGESFPCPSLTRPDTPLGLAALPLRRKGDLGSVL